MATTIAKCKNCKDQEATTEKYCLSCYEELQYLLSDLKKELGL